MLRLSKLQVAELKAKNDADHATCQAMLDDQEQHIGMLERQLEEVCTRVTYSLVHVSARFFSFLLYVHMVSARLVP